MMHTGPVVELEVAKQGAIYHGLAELLAKPSPLLSPRGRPGSAQPQQWMMEQHLYQNHRPGPPNGPLNGPPNGPMMSPMSRPPNMRSASIQNLGPQTQPPMASSSGPPMLGHRQASHPALMNGNGLNGLNGLGGQRLSNGDDQGYYQNIATTNLQQPMPLRYNNGPQPQQRYGSQSSLQPPPQPPIQPQQPQPRFQTEGDTYHASPRVVGTPQSSTGGPTRLVSMGALPPNLTPTGPEKPQRTYEDNTSKPRSLSQGNPPRGVRFQDPKIEENKVHFLNFSSLQSFLDMALKALFEAHTSFTLTHPPFTLRSMMSIRIWSN